MIMTANQIAYWKNVEENRSNLANERETFRSNLAREVETERSNKAKEFEDWRWHTSQEKENHRANIAREKETARANRAGEFLQQQNLNTQARNAVLTNQYNNRTLDETIRTHRANEREIMRANKAQEAISTLSANYKFAIDSQQQSTNRYNAYTNRLTSLANESRVRNDYIVNLKSLSETTRSNQAREAETTRSNQASEYLRGQSNAIEQRRLDETRRSNRANESLKLWSTNAQLISNLANVSVNALGNFAKLSSQFGGIAK